jgi:hypothetical protein
VTLDSFCAGTKGVLMPAEALPAIVCEEDSGLRKTSKKRMRGALTTAFGMSTVDPFVGQYLPEMGDSRDGRYVINAAGGSIAQNAPSSPAFWICVPTPSDAVNHEANG